MKKLDQFITQNSIWLFATFAFFALWAFWPNYFSKLLTQSEVRFHTHGIAMTLWCIMLIAQASLIKSKNHALHKKIGALSYALVPIIVITTVNLIDYRLGPRFIIPTASSYYSVALMLNATIAFVVLYGLAIKNKKTSKNHAKYMVATVFPMFTPITDRLIYNYFRPLIEIAPTLQGKPLVPVLGFVLADLILAGLVWWEFSQKKKWGPFATSLGVVLMYQISVVSFHQFGFWRSFSKWFISLPLS